MAVDAATAEGALVSADHRLCRHGRKIDVATFAVGANSSTPQVYLIITVGTHTVLRYVQQGDLVPSVLTLTTHDPPQEQGPRA